jgi:hypothetical protein
MSIYSNFDNPLESSWRMLIRDMKANNNIFALKGAKMDEIVGVTLVNHAQKRKHDPSTQEGWIRLLIILILDLYGHSVCGDCAQLPSYVAVHS